MNPKDPSIRRRVVSVRRALAALDRALGRLTAALDGAGTPSEIPTRKTPRTVSPQTRAARKLQGRYIGLMRRLTPGQKADVRRVREQKGIEAAIEKARAFSTGPSSAKGGEK